MKPLLRYFSWRHGRQRPLRVLLGAVAVMLGVALFVSVDIAQTTVVRAYERTVEDLAGKAEWQITRAGGVGVDEEALHRLRDVPGLVAAPVLQRSLVVDGATMLVLGVDFWRDSPIRMYRFEGQPADLKTFVAAAFRPGSVVVTRTFADRGGRRVGSKIEVDGPRGRTTLVVGGILEADGPARAFGGNFALMELRAAQSLFGAKGRFDRIDVAGASREAVAAAVGTAYSVDPVARRNAAVDDALMRIRSTVAISAIALVVGLFIIYNCVSISVIERVREIGILRSIGATGRQILAVILLEWTLVGLAGSAAGVALGTGLAAALVGVIGTSANMYVLVVDVSRIAFSWTGAIAAVVAGTAVAAGAALLPAVEAMRISPIGLLRQGSFHYRSSGRYGRSFACGVALLVASTLLLVTLPTQLPTIGLLGTSLVAFFAIAFCGPQMAVSAARVTRPLLGRFFRIEGFLAADSVGKFPRRTSLTVVAFAGAIAMMVASASIIASFNRSGSRWLEEMLPFDLTLNCSDITTTLYGSATFEDSMVDEVRRTEGVELAYGVRTAFALFRDKQVAILAFDLDGFLEMHRRRRDGAAFTALDSPAPRAALKGGTGVAISENFALLYGVAVGDTLELPTPDGPRRFTVAAEVESYAWPAGVVFMDRDVYKRIWRDDGVTYTDIRVLPGQREAARARVAALVKGRGTFFIYEVADLQKVGRDTMAQGMAMANIQVVIALIIGFLGIVNTLLISTLRRTREIGLLRAIGTSRSQVKRTIAVEAVFIAVVGGLLGVGAGLVGAALPLRLFTMRVTGFWVPFAVPWDTIAIALGASLVLGLAASWLPARRAARMDVLDAIAYE